ncbi:MAG: TraR/DksA family transcriptional regulator [Burkholderiaceae bacterium]|nr:TraR/DksA family transcriptional regulator [Burkholderiaceae bacterium]
MEELNQQQKIRLNKALSERESTLREEIRREVIAQDDYVQLASEVPDPGDQSFANLSVDLGNAAVTRDINELRAVELARKRMQSGTYGECAACGYPIPFERLQAMPTAERCAPCQENYERTHHEGHRGATM